MISNFICPLCQTQLVVEERSYKCQKGHNFDRAKSGYINLLMSQQTKKKRHGDDKLMVQARKEFLESGYYNVLREKLQDVVNKHAKDQDVILDAGCGEGWYTDHILKHLTEQSLHIKMLGIDISKCAVDYAAKRNKKIELAVASIADLPVADQSCDIIISIFAPFLGEECQRALKEDGLLIKVIPLEKHLWSLKKAVYDTPYENVIENLEVDGFELIERHDIKEMMHLTNNHDIVSLFMMTPYYYKTGREDQMKLNPVQTLDTEIEFAILVYRNQIGR